MGKVLIVGGNRGIGLELVRQYLNNRDEVTATVRNTDDAPLLTDLVNGRIGARIEEMDIGNAASIKAAAARITHPLDEIIVVAGSVGGNRQSIEDIDLSEWHHTLDVNTIGPFLVAGNFKGNLAASGNGKLMMISSQLAASTWPAGGRYIYATTKAALNKVGQALAIDWKAEPITVAMIHPGWVRTDMGGPKAPLTVEESVAGIRAVIGRLSKSDSGKFYKWDGTIHAW